MPLRAIPPTAVVTVPWGPLRGAKWIRGSGLHRAWMGLYESEKAGLFKRAIRPGDTVFDIGAHVGYYTLLAGRAVGPAGRVFAFEPLPQNVQYLREHIRLNGLKNVTVFEAAVGAGNGSRRFRADNPYMGHLHGDGDLSVRLVTLDRLWRTGDIQLPDVVKIDVEGAESEVLAGAHEILITKAPTILLATHGHEAHQASCSFLRQLGYDLYPIDDGRIADRCEILGAPSRGERR